MPKAARSGFRVLVVGEGKVGRALHRALRASGAPCRRIGARELGASTRTIGAVELVVLAVRDADILSVAERVASRLEPPCAIVHTAGAVGVEVLTSLRTRGFAIGRAHPLASFVSERRPPSLTRVALVVEGDPAAVRASRAVARRLGMHAVGAARPRDSSDGRGPSIEPRLYHAAAALAANGTAALAATAGKLLERAGVDAAHIDAMLAGLLGTVVQNIANSGRIAALSGPVRRGNVATISAHLDALASLAPEVEALYRALVVAQLPLARSIGEAPSDALDAIDRIARRTTKPSRAPRR